MSLSSSSGRCSCRNGSTMARCISRILRRILCISSLPLCSFTRFKEKEKVVIGQSGYAPGLVARLMGLDSVPLIGPVEESPTMSTAESFKTSRSRHRRIIPAYQELEDDNFFILSFEGKKAGKSSRRIEKSVEDGRRRRECLMGKKKEVNLEFEISGDSQCEIPGNVLLPLNNSCRKRENTEDDLENSSPNSVLEFVGFSVDEDSDSPGETSRLDHSKMREPMSDKVERCGNSRQRKLVNKIGSRVRNCEEKWDEIRELAAMETMKSSWLREEMPIKRRSFVEIGREVESSILDHLLDELINN